MKEGSRKVRTLRDGSVLVGFAGGAADALSLFTRFEAKLDEYHGNLERAAVELVREWRTDRVLRRLEALLAVADARKTFLLGGTGDLIEPDDGILAIGSGGSCAARGGARARRAHEAQRVRDRARVASNRFRASTSTRTTGSWSRRSEDDPLPSRQAWTARRARATTSRPGRSSRSSTATSSDRPRRSARSRSRCATGSGGASCRPSSPAEVLPKNIILIGPTGVGKTEIARRIARLTGSPFVKVEASRFTEVGYVGRDVESMVRDLTEIAVDLVRQEKRAAVRLRAEQNVEERLLALLLPAPRTLGGIPGAAIRFAEDSDGFAAERPPAEADEAPSDAPSESYARTKDKLRRDLRAGLLEERIVEIDVESGGAPTFQIFGNQGLEEMGMNLKDMMPGLFGGKTRRRKLKVSEAREYLCARKRDKLVDPDQVTARGARAGRAVGHPLHRRDRQDRGARVGTAVRT